MHTNELPCEDLERWGARAALSIHFLPKSTNSSPSSVLRDLYDQIPENRLFFSFLFDFLFSFFSGAYSYETLALFVFRDFFVYRMYRSLSFVLLFFVFCFCRIVFRVVVLRIFFLRSFITRSLGARSVRTNGVLFFLKRNKRTKRKNYCVSFGLYIQK